MDPQQIGAQYLTHPSKVRSAFSFWTIIQLDVPKSDDVLLWDIVSL